MRRSRSRAAAILVVLVVLSTAGRAQAARLFLLIAADTSKEGGIYLSTGPDTGYVFDAFYAHVPEHQLVVYGMTGGGPSGDLIWDGPDVRFDLDDLGNKLLAAIDTCPSGPDDTIVFFYSGHGAHDERGHFLLMPDQKTSLSRQTVIERIQRKNPRLAVVITDSCANLVDRGLLAGPALALEQPPRVAPLFDSLFFRASGLVDVNSSTEGQVAAGPIGGGLMVLAMAYLGNRPDFRKLENRGVAVEPIESPGVAIPAMDYDQIIGQRFGWSEHGLHGGFDPDKPSYGLLWANAERRLGWPAVEAMLSEKVEELFRTLHPTGMRVRGSTTPQYTQTPQFYSLPKALPAPPPEKYLSLEPGDVILSINGRPVRDFAACRQAIDRSGPQMEFTARDQRTGTVWRLRTELRPSTPRFGARMESAPGGGVLVTRVMSGSPCTRNAVLGPAGPPAPTPPAPPDAGAWSEPIYRPEPGDRIVEVNGRRINDTSDFTRAVKSSPERMTFRIIGQRSGEAFLMRTRLDPPSARTRLGIGVDNDPRGGVRIRYVRDGHPGTRCQLAR